ncbi:aspartate carbamoyltransferase catalytic subunit [Tessaracoccus sp. OH4464_COT-324]|uniref:aspartate carbamoyltransferase catalytic subunit n=1 Tax=Tessaracoccus sp. OH4464_COT-324 TaxID=2491059 RepID=UPI000F643EFE|nr:aspartate carbamoyltransferase catalytic subunit [Tessaracoccus sp. OH4464_COT-324]RRD46871.1 aspartate carbamoyltransferase catalytic subunit [Tessaracoccus sp. OH4464_COT-324]
MKHLTSINDLTRDDALSILELAREMHDVQRRSVKKLPALKGRTVVNLFFEDSTRTRSSFEIAAKWLSADAINFSAKGSSVSKGESLRDTLLTLDAMGVDAIVMRHPGSGSVHQARQWVRAGVVNAGDGTHEHPTQALLDSYAMGIDVAGRTVSITGDLLHSRVVRSNVLLLNKLGAHVVLVAPPTLLPPGVESWPVEVSYDLDAVLPEVDACMMLRVQRERMAGGFFPSEREYIALYGLTAARLALLKPGAVIAHPGPMNRGLEISSAAADDPRSIVLNQVSAGVAVRMSVLYHLLAGNE